MRFLYFVFFAIAVFFEVRSIEEPGEGHIPLESLSRSELLELSISDRILFVDVREEGEFREGHLPFAINVQGRDIDQEFVDSLDSRKYLVPYCMKDFRGYEAARKLRALGADNVRLIEGFGLNAWKKMGLPLATLETEALALAELRRIASGQTTEKEE